MLNWAARYYPILRILKKQNLYDTGSLLEVGSGPIGIGCFRKISFVGCDLTFSSEPRWPMKAVIGSAADLPFRDKEFEVVVASDVLEHVPPDLRKTVVNECLRVAQKLVIFGYPCGRLAWESDKALLQTYLDRKLAPPDWLSEHMDAPFPEADLMREISGWEVQQQANESIGFHTWLMKREISPTFIRFSSRIMRVAPGVTEFLLKKADRNPSYRQIFTLIRRETVEAR